LAGEFHLGPLIRDEYLEDIGVGDIVYITGVVVTAGDAVHRRLVVDGRPLPVDLLGLAVFHAEPVVRRRGDEWE